MSEERKSNCLQCGTTGVTEGLCPRCLLRSGLAGLTGAPAADDEPVPGYHLLDKIGEGGMGEVFLAEQTVPVRREVAVKLLRAETDAAAWVRRFGMEREALAQLDHPNIAAVLDAGTARDGRPYYVMELVDGLPLTQFCRRAKVPSAGRLRLFATVGAAVQHAHQKGVLHGDLKPTNILVAVDELGVPVPMLIDFGVVRSACIGRTEGVAAPWRFGTPGYASPEQFQPSRAPDDRSDVYSLGIVLRELLDDAPPALRGEARWIVQRATAPVPESRYESAAALAGDVRRLLENQPLEAGPKLWCYRARKFCRRHRRRLVLTSLAFTIAGGAVAVIVRKSWQARAAFEEMESARRTAGMEMLRSEAMNDLAHGLAQAMREPDATRRQQAVTGLLERAAGKADAAAAAGFADAALSIRMALGAAAQGLGTPDEAARHFTAARDLAANRPVPDDPRRRAAGGALARARLAARQYDLAEPLLLALTNETPAAGDSGPDAWDPFLDLTRLYLETRRFDEAAGPAVRAVEATESRFDRRHPVFLSALHLLGRVRTEQKQYEEARRLLTEAAAGLLDHFGPEAPPAVAAGADLAEVEKVLRDMEKLPPP